MTGGGLLVAHWQLSPTLNWSFPYVKGILALLSIFFAFLSAVIFNDLEDEEIDKLSGKETPLTKGLFKRESYMRLGVTYFLLSLFFAGLIGYVPFLVILACHSASFLYSMNPLRLKRFYPISVFFVALASFFALLFGYSIIGGSHSLTLLPKEIPLLTLLVFTIGFVFKDFPDQKGDRSGGIWTLFVLLGEERGRWANGSFLFISYFLAGIILNHPVSLILGLLLGLLSFHSAVRRPYREWRIFILYFIFLLVVLLILKVKLTGCLV